MVIVAWAELDDEVEFVVELSPAMVEVTVRISDVIVLVPVPLSDRQVYVIVEPVLDEIAPLDEVGNVHR